MSNLYPNPSSLNQPRFAVDFEYCQQRQGGKEFRVLCAATQIEGEEPMFWWLDLHDWDDDVEEIRQSFRDYCYTHKDKTFLSYGATAEAECFHALGMNPRDFHWHDLHTDFRQVQNGSDTWNYGEGIFKESEKMKTCCTEPTCDCVKKKMVSIGKRYVKKIACPLKMVDVSKIYDDFGDYDTISPGEFEIRWERLPRTNTNYPVAYYRTEWEWSHTKKENFKDEVEKRLRGTIKGRGFTTEKISPNLVNASYMFAKVERSGDTKDETRDLILENKDVYTPAEVEKIRDYATDDTVDLFDIDDKIADVMQKQTGWSDAKVHKARLIRGRFAANTAFMVRRGLPIDRERLLNLRHNKNDLIGQFYKDFNKEFLPLFSYFKGGWHKRARDFNNFVRHLIKIGHVKSWEKSRKTGDYKSGTAEGSPVDKFANAEPRDGFNPISSYRRISRVTNSVGSIPAMDGLEFADEQVQDGVDADITMLSFLGDDYRLRPYFNPYGTQTARNAPKATGFLPAQAAWLRALVNPPKGKVIVELDYSSEEFWIAAVLSGDPGLSRAYAKDSVTKGDPYLAFAYDAKITTLEHVECFLKYKNYEDEGKEIPEADVALFKEAKQIRKLSKSTVLGIQFGMGFAKLAIKLRADSKDDSITDEYAKELIALHRKAYPKYYEKKAEWEQQYFRNGKALVLKDGWYLAPGKPEALKLSVLNMPIQGCGSAIMHRATDLIIGEGFELIAPVHDAFIFECDEDKYEETCERISDLMIQAAVEITGCEGIRVGAPEAVRHGDYWVTEKGAYDFEKYKWSLTEERMTARKGVHGDECMPYREPLPVSKLPKVV